MAFPVVEGRQTGSTTVNATTHAITFPASIAAGELLLVFVSEDGSQVTADNEGHWLKISGQQKNSTIVTGAVFAKIAEASGSLDDLTVITASEQISWISFRISGHGGLPTGTWANGSSTNSDPPSHTPPYGAQDYLWIASRHGDANVGATAAPTNYGNLNGVTHANAGGASVHTAERELNASSENPGTFTSNTEQWAACTIAVPPADMAFPRIKQVYYVDNATAGTGSLVTNSFTPEDGEVIVVKAATNDTGTVIGSTSGGGLSYTRQSSTTSGSFCYAVLDTAVVSGSPGSMTVTVPFSGDNGVRGLAVERWEFAQLDASPAVNGTKTGSGAPSATVTTEADGSVVTWLNADWNVVAPGAYAYRDDLAEDAIGVIDNGAGLSFTWYGGYQYAESAGSQTIGLSSPAGQAWAMHGIEVQYLAPSSDASPDAENAAGTGTAYSPTPKVSPAAGHASGTGAANAPTPNVKPNAGNAAGAGSAFDASVTSSSNASAEHAAGTGAANAPTPNVKPNAEHAAGTGSAFDATVTTESGIANADAELASGTGTAYSPAASIAPAVELASGTGSAFDATVSSSSNASAEHAAGTGTAYGPSAAVAPSAGNAAGTGSAFDAAVTGASNASAEVAAGTGAAFNASAAISAGAESASGTGTAYAPTPAVAPAAELASGTGAAYDAAVTVVSDGQAGAEHAAGTGTAYDATASTSSNVSAGHAAGTGSAFDASVSTSISVSAGHAAGAGSAFDAAASVAPVAELAAGTGTAYAPTPSVAPAAGHASGSGSAYDPAVGLPFVPPLGAGTPVDNVTRYAAGAPADDVARYLAGAPDDDVTRYGTGALADDVTRYVAGTPTDNITRYAAGAPT